MALLVEADLSVSLYKEVKSEWKTEHRELSHLVCSDGFVCRHDIYCVCVLSGLFEIICWYSYGMNQFSITPIWFLNFYNDIE